MRIKDHLIYRLHRIVAYFYGQVLQVPLYGQSSGFANPTKSSKKLTDLLPDEESDQGAGGGGGTARGLRVEKTPARSK